MIRLNQQLFLMFLFLTLAAHGQTLWQGTAKGMSPEQVLGLIEGSELVEDGGEIKSGAKALVHLKHIEIANQSFRAEFYFKDGELQQVALDPNDEKLSISSAKVIFSSLLTSLRAKYGNELSFDKTPMIWEVEWLSDEGTNVALVLVSAGRKAILRVIYQNRLIDEVDKL